MVKQSIKKKSCCDDTDPCTFPADQSAEQKGALAIAHPVQIVRLLIGRSTSVCGEIVDDMPLARSTVSQHLKILKESGLVQVEVDGPKVCYCRISISDIALKQLLPPDVASSLQAYVGRIAGAMMISEYKRLLKQAGFEAVVVADAGTDLNVYAQASSAGCRSPSPAASCCAPASGSTAETNGALSTVHNGLEQVLPQVDVNAYAASFRVYAALGADSVTPPHDKPPVSEVPHSSSMISPLKMTTMKTIRIYDLPVCCSAGICNPSVDPVLPRFAADLYTMKNAGHAVERYNLS
jgi:ArsR family transcriptional regulator